MHRGIPAVLRSSRATTVIQKAQVTRLENQLVEIDREEQCFLYRGSFAADANTARVKILEDANKALAEYGKRYVNCLYSPVRSTPQPINLLLAHDTMLSNMHTNIDGQVKRNIEILSLLQAPQRSVASLLNWVNSTCSIVRSETAFLHSKGLYALGGPKDCGIAWVEDIVERISITLYKIFIQEHLPRLVQRQSSGEIEIGSEHSMLAAELYSEQLFLFEGTTLRLIVYLCLVTLIVVLLLVPVFVMQAMSSAMMHMICITLMSILFTMVMLGPIKA